MRQLCVAELCLAKRLMLAGCFSLLIWVMPLTVLAQYQDTLVTTQHENGVVLLQDENKHSPHKASIYSAVLPGMGQIYNKKYWKVPILYGGIGGFAYAIHFNSKYYNRYRSAYRDFLIRDPGNTSYEWVIRRSTLTLDDVHGPYADWFQRALDNKRRYYKRYRDLSYIGMSALYILNIIDATIDAHFFDFDISDDLSFRLEPTVLQPFPDSGGMLGLQLKFQF